MLIFRKFLCQRGLCFSAKYQASSHYSKKSSFSRDFLAFIQQDFSIARIMENVERKKNEILKQSQKYIKERHDILGPDLATSHFIVYRGGAVKFESDERWFRKDKHGKYYLPNKKVDGLVLEAVDASETNLMYEGFENFIDLPGLSYLNLSRCPKIDDWCMAKLYMFQGSLEFLDVSGCQNVTEKGLACLYHLKKLKGLVISEMPKVGNKELLVILLEEQLPNCKIIANDCLKISESIKSEL